MGSKRVMAFVVLGVLAIARPSDAGWLDIIWEMSGPRMLGLGGQCERSLKRDADWRCLVPLVSKPGPGNREMKDHWLWISAESYYYFSTGGNGFKAGAVQAVGVDPMLLLNRTKNRVRVTSGVGLTLQRFWSSDFDSFGNAGFKFRPIAVEFPLPVSTLKMNVAYNLRYYWDGFESTAPSFRRTDQAETVHGIVFALTF